jgi:hypothetical protein
MQAVPAPEVSSEVRLDRWRLDPSFDEILERLGLETVLRAIRLYTRSMPRIIHLLAS